MYMVDCENNGDRSIGKDTTEGTGEIELSVDQDKHQEEIEDNQEGQASDE